MNDFECVSHIKTSIWGGQRDLMKFQDTKSATIVSCRDGNRREAYLFMITNKTG